MRINLKYVCLKTFEPLGFAEAFGLESIVSEDAAPENTILRERLLRDGLLDPTHIQPCLKVSVPERHPLHVCLSTRGQWVR
jgi:hypothetical protein